MSRVAKEVVKVRDTFFQWEKSVTPFYVENS